MPADKRERRPLDKAGVPEIALGNGDRFTVRSAAHIPPPRPPERQLAAWLLAVQHLHALGLPAAVPPFPAAWLRRRGIRPDWETAA